MLELVPKDQAERIHGILSDLESSAEALMSPDFVTAKRGTTVGEILKQIRGSQWEHDKVSYVFVLSDRIALWALRVYLIVLLVLIGIKFVRVFSASQAAPAANQPSQQSAP